MATKIAKIKEQMDDRKKTFRHQFYANRQMNEFINWRTREDQLSSSAIIRMCVIHEMKSYGIICGRNDHLR